MTKREAPSGGLVVYVGTGIEVQGLVMLAAETIARYKTTLGPQVPGMLINSTKVERRIRIDTKGVPWLVTINHGDKEAVTTSVGGTMGAQQGTIIPPYGVRIEKWEVR